MSDEKTPTAPAPTPASFANLGKFKPKPATDLPDLTKEIQKDIDKVAADNGFHSRQAVAAAAKRERFNSAVPKKQLNIKIPLDVHDKYYAMAKKRGNTVLWELLRDALQALEEKEGSQ